MDILCLMGLFPKEYEQIIYDNSIHGMQNAANKFQWGIVSGMDQIPEVKIKIVNSLFIGSYPKRYRKLRIPTFEFSHSDNSNDINVGFLNLSGYKIISRYFRVRKELKRWAEDGGKEDKVLLAYAMTSPFVELVHYVKKHYPKVTCCLVVPDLPEYMNVAARKSKIYHVLKDIQTRHFRKQLRNNDCYVLLTEQMTEWFDTPINYVVVEGISTVRETHTQDKIVTKKKAILYAGMLEEKYGVINLVNSFMKFRDPEWSLELFGDGTAVSKLKELAREDPRIHLCGLVSNAEVLKEQKECELLVNPRDNSEQFTKYSFPSKVIEYMSSGTPMIGYKLWGMPNEYVPYFFCADENENGLYHAIKYAADCTEEERDRRGKEALKFVSEEKNARTQCEKIVRMLRKCIYLKNRE